MNMKLTTYKIVVIYILGLFLVIFLVTSYILSYDPMGSEKFLGMEEEDEESNLILASTKSLTFKQIEQRFQQRMEKLENFCQIHRKSLQRPISSLKGPLSDRSITLSKFFSRSTSQSSTSSPQNPKSMIYDREREDETYKENYYKSQAFNQDRRAVLSYTSRGP